MSTLLEFNLDGVVVRFEQPEDRAEGVVAKKENVAKLVERASSTLKEAAQATAKIAELFASSQFPTSINSIEVELGVKLEGQVGFIFVNSKAEAALTVKATLQPSRHQDS